MAILVTDPELGQRLKSERELSGADRYDEVWEGVYTMAPMPNDEHQGIVVRLAAILQDVIGWSQEGEVRAGVNLSARGLDWKDDYRVPDIAVFLHTGRAENYGTHWRGAADFLVAITSPDDRTREKLPFYSRIGVVELLLVERDPWALELYRHSGGQLQQVGQSTIDDNQVLAAATVPLTFQLVAGSPRPQIAVTHVPSGRRWLV